MGLPGDGRREKVRLDLHDRQRLPATVVVGYGPPGPWADKFLAGANQRLSFRQVRSICVNGSIDYGRSLANRFDPGCGANRQHG